MSSLAEAASLPLFKHSRLQDMPYAFRLIQLFPASDTGQEVSCRLFPSNLEELPTYKALSYVWGDPNVVRNIYIEGKPYPVTKNCYAALACLRHETHPIILWIDAICINQKDHEEKSQQLNIMVEIYAEAEETLIWMGFNNIPWIEASSLGQLRHVESLCVTTIIDLTNSSDGKDSEGRRNAILIEPAMSGIYLAWGSLIAIFSHAWWTRLWVHQELASTKKATVVVGLQAFAWDLFLPLFRILCSIEFGYSKADLLVSPTLEKMVLGYWHLLKSNGYQSLTSRYLARDTEQLRRTRVQLHHLQSKTGEISTEDTELFDHNAEETMDLLYWTRSYHCSDSRDHVFALRGMLTDGTVLAKGDYTKPTKDIYAGFAHTFIDLYQSTNILRFAGISCRGIDSSDDLGVCPSWIPYLGTIADFGSLSKVSKPLWSFNYGKHFAAAKGLGRGRQIKIAESNEQLSIFGYTVDTLDIVQSLPTDASGLSIEDYDRKVWQELALNLPPLYPTGCDPKHALFGAINGIQSAVPSDSIILCQKYVSGCTAWLEHRGTSNKKGEPKFEFDNRFAPMASEIVGQGMLGMLKETPGSSEFALALKASIENATAGRKFLCTERGFMGLAPGVAEVGDEVWILLGCDVPMLLRKCGDIHILVGECFVYGIMEGEQSKDLLASGPPRNVILD